MILRPYQSECVRKTLAGFREFRKQLVVIPTGGGKCLARGTQVLLHSGRTIAVEHVRVGDALMGPDSKPRYVRALGSGTEMLYEVTPVKGEPYRVNEAHILSLVITNGAKGGVTCGGERFASGEIANVNVLDYLSTNTTFRHCAKGWRAAVDFPTTYLHPKLPPYMLGLWLGDGCARFFSVSKPDGEIRNVMADYARWLGHSLREDYEGTCPVYHIVSPPGSKRGCGCKLNEATNALASIGVLNNKHIPHAYKCASRECRMELLAGLMDSDGTPSKSGFDFISKDRKLSDDVAFVARSLGMSAQCEKGCQTGNVGIYWRVSINGDCASLPLHIERKRAAVRQQKKNVLVTGIRSVCPVGAGEYFGFELDGDGLFLLADFTVTHNTIVFAHLAKQVLGRTLILAHREELIEQAANKLHKAVGLFAGIEKAERRATLHDQVIVASVQSMANRLDKFPRDHFRLVVADEAHHAVSNSWKKVLDYFEPAWVLGVTATPDRGDKRALGEFFENIAYEVSLREMIEGGYLADIIIKCVPLKIDLNSVKQTAGDFDEAETASVLEPLFPQIVAAVREHAAGRRCLAFLPLRATSRAFVAACQAQGLRAEHIDGESEFRREILTRFAGCQYDVLSNAMLLTEGFDDPGIDCIIPLRPTRSRALFAQCVGRGTRTAGGKQNLLLLDFLWQHEKHKLIRPASLISESDEEAEAITRMTIRGDDSDILGLSAKFRAEKEQQLAEALAAQAKRSAKFIGALDFALQVHDVSLAEWEPTMAWHSKKPSPRQLEVLVRNGFDAEEFPTRGKASAMLDLLFKRMDAKMATPKQMRALKRLGYESPEKATFAEASAFLNVHYNRQPISIDAQQEALKP